MHENNEKSRVEMEGWDGKERGEGERGRYAKRKRKREEDAVRKMRKIIKGEG